MKQVITTKNNAQSTQINRYAYILFMGLVIYLVFKGDYDWALTNMGVALVFDPFDASVKWQDRPRYQKAWLLIHVAIMAIGFVYIFLMK
jgi:hypothetical protein